MLKSGDVESAFNAGAAMINLGSIAVKDPGSTLIIIHRFGKEKFILGADVKGERVVVSGWMEKSNFTLWAYLAKWTARGLNTVCCTDVSHDGTLMGPSVRLYSRLREKFPEITLIASGGVGSPEDVCKLDAIGMDAIIIGKAIYEGLIKPEELAGFIQKRHVI
jgi:phosphoribosylformimino-5-aminoimidazole carboxamide ribotide isomerase